MRSELLSLALGLGLVLGTTGAALASEHRDQSPETAVANLRASTGSGVVLTTRTVVQPASFLNEGGDIFEGLSNQLINDEDD